MSLAWSRMGPKPVQKESLHPLVSNETIDEKALCKNAVPLMVHVCASPRGCVHE